MMKKILLSIITLLALSLSVNAQNVNIPDANFKTYLVGNTAINTSGDSEIQVSEASAFNGTINCSYQSISNLTGIEAFTAITELYCNNNQLTSLDVFNNTDLTFLRCENNQLTSLDISNNTDLTILRFDYNQLTSLDISNNTDLTYLNCNNNQLTSLNVANGNNPNFTQFFATNNPNLTCIQVDDATYSTTNWTNIDATASFSTSCGPCIVNIPDSNFKAYLVGNTAINTNGDTEIQCSEASSFGGTINCSSMGISDLTGIEAFTSLNVLLCNFNSISNLDITQNTTLANLECNNNLLTSLNVSQNSLLAHLECNNNSITSLDVSQNLGLTFLWCAWNSISSLDVNSNTNLINLDCYGNLINSLDLSQNLNLTNLNCGDNNLSSLDVSLNTMLTQFRCNTNPLSSLNVANGNNTNFAGFYANHNPNLTCIQVDDAVYSATNWTFVDAIASFSTNCGAPCTVNIPDANFKAYLVGNAAINTNSDTEIQCSEASAFTGLIQCYNLAITDLTGIETFTALTELNCGSNSLTSLNVNANTALTLLRCADNSITSLDVNQNTLLTTLDCSNNSITSLDVSQNTGLIELDVHGNDISSIDVSQHTSLDELDCGDNNLTSLDVSQNTALDFLLCNHNSLTSLDISQNTALTKFYAHDNLLTSLDLTQNTGLTLIYIQRNNIISLDLSQNTAVYNFSCSDNSLTSLNIKNGNNTNLNNFFAGGNPNLTCVDVDDVTYSTTNWTNIDATTSFSTNCSAVYVSSISVQGAGNVSTITTNGGTLQMQATVLPANADDATYTWSVTNGTGAATIGANGLLTATADGTVEVKATANDGSGITGTKTITISNQSVGINDISFEGLNIYPNPTSDILNLEIEEELTSIKILDLTGKTIKEFNAEDRQLDLSELTSGIYFLELANAEKKSVVKLVKR